MLKEGHMAYVQKPSRFTRRIEDFHVELLSTLDVSQHLELQGLW